VFPVISISSSFFLLESSNVVFLEVTAYIPMELFAFQEAEMELDSCEFIVSERNIL
jgi:hypothetical protein